MDYNEIKSAIASLLSFRVVDETDDRVVYRVYQDRTAVLYKSRINEIIDELSHYSSEEGVELFDGNSYEVIVRRENRILISSDRNIVQVDSVNNLEYQLGVPSDRYLVSFLCNLFNHSNSFKILRSGVVMMRIRNAYDHGNFSDECDVLDLIKCSMPRFDTLQILNSNPRHKSKEEFENLVYSFLFNLGYNNELIIKPLRFIDEYIQSYSSGRIRRVAMEDIDAPKRLYINELVLHYQKGMSSDNIDHQYLSFYHVLEFFYEKVYNDDILNSVRMELTKPNFSYKRNKDIAGLVGLIQKKLKYKNEEFLINEPEALSLTLQKFVREFGGLVSELSAISDDLPDYYKTHEVSFSKGNKVDLSNADANNIYTNLSKRIYLTRNSIVHSKENDKNKYVPFRDDKELSKEVYLIRLLAEMIIIESSREL